MVSCTPEMVGPSVRHGPFVPFKGGCRSGQQFWCCLARGWSCATWMLKTLKRWKPKRETGGAVVLFGWPFFSGANLLAVSGRIFFYPSKKNPKHGRKTGTLSVFQPLQAGYLVFLYLVMFDNRWWGVGPATLPPRMSRGSWARDSDLTYPDSEIWVLIRPSLRGTKG